jgi:hypothetical protein
MKKLTLLVSALTAGVFASAQAEVSVSGSSTIAYQSADSNNNTAHGGAVSFGLSTTTDTGMTVSSSAGISLSASSAAAARAVTGFENITFATGGVSITVGSDVGVPDGTGDVGGVVGDITILNNNGMSKTVKISDDEGVGFSLSTSLGAASLTLVYIADDSDTTPAIGDIDGATGTGTGASIATTFGDVGVTASYVTNSDTNIDDTETGIALTYATAMGALSVGYEASTGTLKGNQYGVAYAMDLSGATSLTIGYTQAQVDSLTGRQTDIALAHSLGGGVSVFGEMRTVSGSTVTDTSSTSDTTMAIGTTISF